MKEGRNRRKYVRIAFAAEESERAVSPVIAVAFMIALAGGLAALVAVTSTDLIDDFGPGPDGDVTFEEDRVNGELTIGLVRLDTDVDEVHIRGDGSGEFETVEVGAIETITGGEGDDIEAGDHITVVAINSNDGQESQIGSYVLSDDFNGSG